MTNVVFGIMQNAKYNNFETYIADNDGKYKSGSRHYVGKHSNADYVTAKLTSYAADIKTIFILHDASSEDNDATWIVPFVQHIKTIRPDLSTILVIIGPNTRDNRSINQDLTIRHIILENAENTPHYRTTLLKQLVHEELQQLIHPSFIDLASKYTESAKKMWSQIQMPSFMSDKPDKYDDTNIESPIDAEHQDSKTSLVNNNISMKFLGGVIAALGITALVIALIALALHAQSLAIVVVITGVAATLVGCGIFAKAHYQNLQENNDKTLNATI
jgi:hypothetical protein